MSHIKVIAMIYATKITLALYVMNHRLGTSIYKRPKGSFFPKETNVEVGMIGTMDKALVSVRNLIVVTMVHADTTVLSHQAPQHVSFQTRKNTHEYVLAYLVRYST